MKFNLFIYQSGVEFSSESNEIGFNAVSLVSFMQIRLKNPFLQLNIFTTVGEFIRQKYSTIWNLLNWKMADLQPPPTRTLMYLGDIWHSLFSSKDVSVSFFIECARFDKIPAWCPYKLYPYKKSVLLKPLSPAPQTTLLKAIDIQWQDHRHL